MVGNEAGSPPYNGARPGDQIGLFVNGIQAQLYNPATGATTMSYPWTSGASTRLDLKVNPVYTIAATAGAGGTVTPSGNVAVPFGANQAFAIAANPGYSIADVLVDGVSQGAITSYTFTNVQANHTISATFVQQTFTITPTAGANGSISPATPQVVPSGGSATFTITPSACYTIADVLVDGASVGAVASYTFNNVQANHTIHATFVRLSYTIAASAGAGGTITPSGNVAVHCGANQAFAIAPGTGYNIADVVVDGISQGAVGSYTFTNVQANHTISATFALKTFVITPTAGTGGSISPATPQTVSYGGNKGFTITPDGCHTIADVLVDGVSVGAVPSYTFTNVTTAHTIHATFAHSGVSYTIAASAGAGGLIAPSGNVSVLCGANQAFAVAVTPGYYIADVFVDGASVGAVSSYTFTNVQANHTISASFTRQTYVITPSAGAGGSISPATPQTIPSGGSVAFTITPSACYMIADVLVDGASVGAVSEPYLHRCAGRPHDQRLLHPPELHHRRVGGRPRHDHAVGQRVGALRREPGVYYRRQWGLRHSECAGGWWIGGRGDELHLQQRAGQPHHRRAVLVPHGAIPGAPGHWLEPVLHAGQAGVGQRHARGDLHAGRAGQARHRLPLGSGLGAVGAGAGQLSAHAAGRALCQGEDGRQRIRAAGPVHQSHGAAVSLAERRHEPDRPGAGLQSNNL